MKIYILTSRTLNFAHQKAEYYKKKAQEAVRLLEIYNECNRFQGGSKEHRLDDADNHLVSFIDGIGWQHEISEGELITCQGHTPTNLAAFIIEKHLKD